MITLRGHRLWPPTRLGISVGKATVALTALFILVFSRSFSSLEASPVALASAVLVVVVGGPGKALGGCLESLILGGVGLSAGVAGFTALGYLSFSPVAQGFIFIFYVYGCALIRWNGVKWVSFYLFAILFAFQGMYTAIVDTHTVSTSLLAYFQAYLWGGAIVLVVNVLVWPITAESRCRRTLVDSLRHISATTHLIAKGYEMSIAPDEVEVRDILLQTLRTDFVSLSALLHETSFEFAYSKWNMREYRAILEHIQIIQQALLTASSALDLIAKLDPEGINVKSHFLAREGAAQTFDDFRRGTDAVISEIIDSFLDLSKFASSLENLDMEAQDNSLDLQRVETVTSMAAISTRLRREVERSDQRHHTARVSREGRTLSREATLDQALPTYPPVDEGVSYFRSAWENFAKAQSESIILTLKEGSLQVGNVLRMELGSSSLQAMYPSTRHSSLSSPSPPLDLASDLAKPTELSTEEREEGHELDAPCSRALTTSYSMLFGLGELTDELCAIHKIVTTPRSKRMRFHLFEDSHRLWSNSENSMSLLCALSTLQGKEYVPPTVTLNQRVNKIERWLVADRSVYAARVALGAITYTVILLTPAPQTFFVQFSLFTSLITVVVGISPTLGQSLFTFLLQLFGTSLGSLYGLAILEIFKGRGGYKFNPFGLAAGMFIWSMVASFVIYVDPRYFSGGLLMMNGAGVLVILEYLYNEQPSVEAPYPLPPLRTGYAITAMAISIAIAALFQVFVFRTPARSKLRLDIAATTFALGSYNTLLQSYINSVAPVDEVPKPNAEALDKVHSELIKRERRLQKQIAGLQVVYDFAKVEPNFKSNPFKSDVLKHILQSHQTTLDRLRESRKAVGRDGFGVAVHHEVVSVLKPYRIHSQRLTRTLFYLCATSMQTKSPLPRGVPSSRLTWASFENDALFLSRKLGEEQIRSPGFLRYWFYLVSLGAVSAELEEIEGYLGELLGVPEETNPLIF